ncbi:MAG: methylenetetrahydrofolate--tRNA-(uracil(54)-C(5))-methyltransferase (FADH(2)-oxidizing) TrmFO [Deltaproteobacteria bacterium]|nr:methylenetetrahydrofolate--tRNA-(uracil(54)-C(5))-methyltransferase (FADH(2)-oxidizing) TrmFO [Deltaproteobacteria bacterium]
MKEVSIIGGGMAGVEAAFMIARLGGRVTLYEMKPVRFSAAHTSGDLAELVCSNSLKSVSLDNASGLLKEEMRSLGSLVITAAEAERVPAGTALAVDRQRFSAFITERLKEAGVKVVREEIIAIPPSRTAGGPSGTAGGPLRPLIVASGPLTSDGLAAALQGFLGSKGLYFYDAISPVVYRDSIDFTTAFMASRYNKGGADYINCPMDRTEYETFVREIVSAEKTPLRAFEKIPFFEGCMPVETLAERGVLALAFGPMRPVGIIDPRTGRRPWGVVQLRRETREDTLYNMVGFQTRLTHPEQKRVFSLIPGLRDLSFARYGSIHRNSYIHSPSLLLKTLQLKKDPGVFFAGQMTGVEGYCESAATGIIAGVNAWRLVSGLLPVFPPATTMIGALLDYITDSGRRDFQPMNANFGILIGAGGKKKREALVKRALSDMEEWKIKTLESQGGIC